jgi:hypothetical protein
LNQVGTKSRGDSGRAGLFFRLFQGAPLEGCERSIKLSERVLFANRYLCGFSKSAIAENTLFDLCKQLEMPEDYLFALQERLPETDVIHFGFEENESGFIYKVYLEYAARYFRALEGDLRGIDKVMVHIAYKWDAVDPGKRAIARYIGYPGLSTTAILGRMAVLYGDKAYSRSFAAIKDIIGFASDRSAEAPMYLEVSEEGNPRASFDINLHDANMRLNDIESQIRMLGVYFSISTIQMQRLLEQIRGEKIGHLSGGISRTGNEFMTVYYEADYKTNGHNSGMANDQP